MGHAWKPTTNQVAHQSNIQVTRFNTQPLPNLMANIGNLWRGPRMEAPDWCLAAPLALLAQGSFWSNEAYKVQLLFMHGPTRATTNTIGDSREEKHTHHMAHVAVSQQVTPQMDVLIDHGCTAAGHCGYRGTFDNASLVGHKRWLFQNTCLTWTNHNKSALIGSISGRLKVISLEVSG